MHPAQVILYFPLSDLAFSGPRALLRPKPFGSDAQFSTHMRFLPRPAFVFFCVGLLALTGCRTYGGYGSEEATYRQMQQANRQFANDLERARADLEALEDAAAQNDALTSYAERFQALVQRHEQTLEEHRATVEGMSASDDYRSLHRSYGTIITEARILRKQYNRVVERVRQTVRGESGPTVERVDRSAYFVEPVEYKAERNAQRLTMDEALRGVPRG